MYAVGVDKRELARLAKGQSINSAPFYNVPFIIAVARDGRVSVAVVCGQARKIFASESWILLADLVENRIKDWQW